MRRWILDLLPALGLAMASAAAILIAAHLPRPGEPVVAFFAPGTSAAIRAHAVAAADGALIADRPDLFAIVAVGTGAAFADRLAGHGAWFVLAAEGSIGCSLATGD